MCVCIMYIYICVCVFIYIDIYAYTYMYLCICIDMGLAETQLLSGTMAVERVPIGVSLLTSSVGADNGGTRV